MDLLMKALALKSGMLMDKVGTSTGRQPDISLSQDVLLRNC